jgi:PAS domain S-box-containing protein
MTRPDQTLPIILAVDDEPEILTALADLFEGEAQILRATSPIIALDLLSRRGDIAVIISDERMPDMMGHQFLREARRICDAEAILLTGYADLSAVVDALNEGGIAGYVAKPWEESALRTMVAGVLSRRRLRHALELERGLLHGLLENAGDAISFKDDEGRFIRLNRRKAAMLGRTIRECLGARERDLSDEAYVQQKEALERALFTGGEAVNDVLERADEASARWYAVNGIPIRDESGVIRSSVTIERDITEQRLLETRMRLADKMQALGTLVGGVAHDFNNLLTAILGNIELATKRASSDERLKRLLLNAGDAARRSAALTQRLLTFSRNQEADQTSVEVGTMLEGMKDLLRQTLGATIEISLQVESDLWPVCVDQTQLELAVLNLCVNARDAMPNGGRIEIVARNEHRRVARAGREAFVVICVRDTGSGIPPDVLPRVFDPFFTTKDVGKGTGLGLSMVHGFATQSGGRVDIDSQLGTGTTVTIRIPRGEAAVTDSDTQESSSVRRRRLNVLLVDDDPDVRSVTYEFLSELGHDITEAGGGEAALEIWKQGRFDIVLADFSMPVMTGVDLAARIHECDPHQQVTIMTGYADADRIPPSIAILQKPFSLEQLRQALESEAGNWGPNRRTAAR